MVGLSPLPTAHPSSFQPTTVRASILCYQNFTLAMGRSSRFGSAACNCIALFRLAFATASPNGLTLLQKATRRLIKQKARGHTVPKDMVLPLLVSVRVQFLFHSPRRGSFHLSLTVLVHYRSQVSIQPWKMVLPDSHGISRVPRYSGTLSSEVSTFRLRGYHPLRQFFPGSFSYILTL